MIKQFILLLILSLGFTQDEYPYFSDPVKQLEFEEQRIYVIEENAVRQYISGGGSYESLANPFGYLLGEDPDYIAIQKPIKTEYQYHSTFKLIRNNEQLSEVSFLNIIGLKSEADKIIAEHNNKLEAYNQKVLEYNKDLSDYNNAETLHKKGKMEYFNGDFLCLFGLGGLGSGDETMFVVGAVSLGIGLVMYTIPKGRKDIYYKEVEKPYTIQKPTIRQTLANSQITSLAESYNRKLYKQLTNN